MAFDDRLTRALAEPEPAPRFPIATAGALRIAPLTGTSPIADELRRIADEIDAGCFIAGSIATAVFVAGNAGEREFAWRRADMGDRRDSFSIRGLLSVAGG